MSAEKRKPKISLFTKVLIGIFVVVFLISALDLCHHCPDYHFSNKTNSMNNGRGIVLAWGETVKKTKKPVSASSIHEWAAIIAGNSELNDVRYWAVNYDFKIADFVALGGVIPNQIVTKNENGYVINDAFKKLPISWVVVNDMPMNIHPNTPILWTRGLNPNGAWDRDEGVFEDKGGHIVFADMSVQWFASLRNEDNPKGFLKKYGTNEPTYNIYEAIPGGEKSVLKSE